ncbi:MAG: patatin-like phospholipase family protein [Cytophagales bacterium]|nr:patatin-like phospholipase family protein [Cytophagales bacterium]
MFRIIFFTCLFVLNGKLYAQDSKRPKVAVVLSGGGMKGVAHVGVLKALEEQGVPIDYIVGTSMGAIVGGMYASGYSPDAIVQYISNEKFQDWLQGIFKKEYQYYYAMDEENPSWFSINIALDSTFKASFVSGLAEDVALNFALNELTAQASAKANENFDSLFVPFIAMASEIFTQESVQLRSGTVADAMRASMTVPLVYRPIKINNKYYFDGGVYNNFPVNVAVKEFHPDYIIGVNVSSKEFHSYPYGKDDQLLNNTLLFAFLDRSNPKAIGDSGVYISPNLEGYSALDFGKIPQIIDSGYQEALRKIPVIKKDLPDYISCDSVYVRRNAFISQEPPLVFKDINYTGYKPQQVKFIKNFFGLRNKNNFYQDDLEKGFTRLVSLPYFKDTYPRMIWDKKKNGYVLDLTGKSKQVLRIGVGGNISYNLASSIFLGLEFTELAGPILIQNRLNLQTGSFYTSGRVSSKFFMPYLTNFYVKPEITYNSWNYINRTTILDTPDSSLILKENDQALSLEFGLPLSFKGKSTFDISYIKKQSNYLNEHQTLSRVGLNSLKLDGLKLGFKLTSNSLNRPYFSTEGKKFTLQANYFNLKGKYKPHSDFGLPPSHEKKQWGRIKASLNNYFKITKFYSLSLYLEGLWATPVTFFDYRGTLINSPVFSPLKGGEILLLENFRSPKYLAAGSSEVFSFTQNIQFRIDGFVFVPFQQFKINGDQSTTVIRKNTIQPHLILGASLAYLSPIGPISMHYNFYDTPKEKHNFFVTLGLSLYNLKVLD